MALSATDDAKVQAEKWDIRVINAYFRLYSFVAVCKRKKDMPPIQDKTCIECSATFKGRVDKKFCSDQCRSSYNNRLNSDETSYMRNVNNILRKNRRILLDLNPDGKNRVSREKLKGKGFDFQHFTSTYTTKEGAQYFYCYEQGYLPIEKDSFLLVVKKEFAS